MKSAAERLAWALKNCEESHVRMTPVRRAILAFLAERRTPASLDVIARVKGVRDQRDGTTVYRTVMMFKEAGLVRCIGTATKTSLFVLRVPDENSRFLVCERCGAAVEVELPVGVLTAIEELGARHGFAASWQCVQGLCRSCEEQAGQTKGVSKLAARHLRVMEKENQTEKDMWRKTMKRTLSNKSAKTGLFRSGRVIGAISLLAWEAGVAQTNTPAISDSSGTNVTKLAPTEVIGKLDVAREQIVPSLGATSYGISKEQIEAIPQGENAGINQVILRAPGTAQDGLGQLHLRGEHANLQYRINDVLLPEGITGFGQELDARFVDEVHLVTGSLPAQYGFRTAGIVDIHTKTGAFEPGGQAGIYGGSYETIKPSFEYGGSKGNLNYFVDGSYNHNNIGIENPTPSHDPIHDITDQYKTFGYLSYVLDDTSRISVMGSASYADFEIPNTPGLPPGTSPGGTNWSAFMSTTNFNSANLNARQNEQNYYGIGAYQKSVGDVNLQLAGFGRASSVHFRPDQVGDLFFNGVASDVNRRIYSGGVEGDMSYALNDKHTVRAGFMVLDETASIHTSTGVFPTDANGDPTGVPFSIPDNSTLHALFFGAYLQDEWKILPKVTLNFGARFDLIDSFVDENQASPRVNIIYQPVESTALHAGYARYFTPPALENVEATDVNKFNGTSNESEVKQGDRARSERADYFDAGITHKLLPGLQVGVDAYYKKARNQLDDGFFGQSLILSQFNYRDGKVYGVEFTGNYTVGGFSTYANIAYSVARGKDIVAGQFLFSQADLDYIRTHWIPLDHDQRVTGSFGAAYAWKRSDGSTKVFVDAIYGSGLRTTVNTPNDSTVPDYYSVNLGLEEGFIFHGKERLKLRLDVVNITDNSYILRDGAGVGVNAAQHGIRLGFFGGVSFVF